ncbi:MAG: hypothetical protein ACHQUC_09825 [Chlamydiales bacterium]
MSSRIIGSMTQLVETKNLNQKLYQVSSKHLDLAIPPLKPPRPLIYFYALLTALFGCLIFYLYKLCNLLIKGFPVSPDNLKFSGLSCHGLLSSKCSNAITELKESDVETLQNLAHYISSLEGKNCVALISGKTPDCSPNLCELLFLSGKKILLIQCTAQNPQNDLSHYIRGIEKTLSINTHAYYDELCCACHAPYGNRSLAHPAFHTLLSELKEKYDLVILHSDADLDRGEAYAFMPIADAIILAAYDESQEDIYPFRMWAEAKTHNPLALVCFE